MSSNWTTIGPLPKAQFRIEAGTLEYSYDAGATWHPLGTVQGEQGEQGEQGPVGETGPQGPQGEQGPSERYFVYGEQPGGDPKHLQVYTKRQQLLGDGTWEDRGLPVPMPLLTAPSGASWRLITESPNEGTVNEDRRVVDLYAQPVDGVGSDVGARQYIDRLYMGSARPMLTQQEDGRWLLTINNEFGPTPPGSQLPTNTWTGGSVILPSGGGGGTSYQNISSTTPTGAPHVAYFWRQTMVWDPAANGGAGAWVAQGEPVQIGGVVAPKGDFYNIRSYNPAGDMKKLVIEKRLQDHEGNPLGEWGQVGTVITEKGAKGDPGPPGAVTSTAPPNGAWVSWSFVARNLVNTVADVLVYFADNNYGYQTFNALQQLYSFVMELRDVPQILDMDPQDTFDAWRIDMVRETAAQIVYCKLVNNQSLALSQVQMIDDQLQNEYGHPLPLIMSGTQPAEALAVYTMNCARRDYLHFKNAVSVFHQQSAGATSPNYSFLSCTPAYEDWNSVFDFTQGAGGFNTISGNGIYDPGLGWRAVGNNQEKTVHIERVLPAPMQITQVEIVATNIVYNGQTFRGVGVSKDTNGEWNKTMAQGATIVHSWFNFGSPVIFNSIGGRIGLTLNTASYIKRLSIAGKGSKPAGWP